MMQKTVHEVAKLTGVSIRTLHYYDEIELLVPDEVSSSGYRLYSKNNLKKLQQILFLKELDFSLKEIKEMLEQPNFNTQVALKQHKELLILKRNRLDKIISLIEDTMKGESDMNFEAFNTNEIERATKAYREEVKERWGSSEAYKISEAKTSKYTKKEWAQIMEESEEIYREFVKYMKEQPGSIKVQELVRRWKDYITKNFYPCTKEILAGLGQMYVCDERFTKNIDQYGTGLANFMNEAIQIYCAE